MATLNQTLQPVSTAAGTGSYTVPAGKYAKVVISVSASSHCTSTSGTPTATVGAAFGSSGEDSKTIDTWLKTGDVVTSSLSTASGSVTTAAAQTYQVNGSSSVASALINGTTVVSARAAISVGIYNGNSANTFTITMTGSSSYGFIASEYNNTF